MPPRYAYWTILIDGKATAFRAREREELLPTFNQLARKNADIAMRYFARGRLWDNPEQAQWASRNPATTRAEPRDRDWRPGGEHQDPRARFERKKKTADRKPFRPKDHKPSFDERSSKPANRFAPQERRERPKWQSKPGDRPFQPKERRERPKWNAKPGDRPLPPKDQRERPKWNAKPGDRPLPPKEQREPPKWSAKPGDRPLPPKERRERPKWQGKQESKPFQPKDRREPGFEAGAARKPPGRWSRPPKRKPR